MYKKLLILFIFLLFGIIFFSSASFADPANPSLPFYPVYGFIVKPADFPAGDLTVKIYPKADPAQFVSAALNADETYILNIFQLHFNYDLDIVFDQENYQVELVHNNIVNYDVAADIYYDDDTQNPTPKTGNPIDIKFPSNKGQLKINFGLTKKKPLDIVTAAELPPGTVGVDYKDPNGNSVILQAEGGIPPYTWSWSGITPKKAGLSLNPNTGEISGTPNQAGTFNFNITVTDSLGGTVTETFNLVINNALGDGPVIDLTVLLGGYYNIETGTQKVGTVVIEARDGADVTTATTIMGVCEIQLDENGFGTNNGSWTQKPADGDYFIVVKHKIPNVPPPGPDRNHIPIITSDKWSLAVAKKLTLDLSDGNDNKVYTPQGKVSAMRIIGNKLAMRGGYLSDDKLIDISDYAIWKGAITTVGDIDWNKPYSIISDINADNIIDISDYAIWKGTVFDYAPDSIPQTTDHVYVPEKEGN